MQSFRKAVLIFAMAGVSIGARCSFAQQEVAPDHYEQPVAAKSAAKAPEHKSTAVRTVHGKTHVASHRGKQPKLQPAA